MEVKTDRTLIPITDINPLIQHYVRACHTLNILNAQRAQIQAEQKKYYTQIHDMLMREPNTKLQFEVADVHKEEYGNVIGGLRLYKRKRDEVFNGKTFAPAMIKQCVPVFREYFPQADIQDAFIEKFASTLAKRVWDSRSSTTKMEVTQIKKSTSSRTKREDTDSKKRKQTEMEHSRPYSPPRVKEEDEEDEYNNDDEDNLEDINSGF